MVKRFQPKIRIKTVSKSSFLKVKEQSVLLQDLVCQISLDHALDYQKS